MGVYYQCECFLHAFNKKTGFNLRLRAGLSHTNNKSKAKKNQLVNKQNWTQAATKATYRVQVTTNEPRHRMCWVSNCKVFTDCGNYCGLCCVTPIHLLGASYLFHFHLVLHRTGMTAFNLRLLYANWGRLPLYFCLRGQFRMVVYCVCFVLVGSLSNLGE